MTKSSGRFIEIIREAVVLTASVIAKTLVVAFVIVTLIVIASVQLDKNKDVLMPMFVWPIQFK
jgi:hypothetical protein